MATTVTVTVTATPTIALASQPCNPVTITVTPSRTATPFGAPLHLLPPYATPTATGDLISLNATSDRPYRGFPYGPAPVAPLSFEPLDLSSVPDRYAPGLTVLLLCLGIVATLRLCVRTDRLCKLSNWSFEGKAAPYAFSSIPFLGPWPWSQVLALIGLNIAAADLVQNLVSLEQTHSGGYQRTEWIRHAGQIGPPLTTLAWGATACLVRITICFVRLSSIKPWSHTSVRHVDAIARASYTVYLRSLALDGLGITLPLSALSVLATCSWVWTSTLDSNFRSVSEKILVSDCIPALYWDGMGTQWHSILIAFPATLGIVCLAVTACILLYQARGVLYDRYPHFVLQMERHFDFQVCCVMWFAVLLLLACGWGVVLFVHFMTGLGEDWVFWAEEMLGYACIAMCVPLLPLAAILILGVYLFALPLAVLSYILRAHVFRGTAAQRSAFFIPWTETSMWEPMQLGLALLGVYLVLHYGRSLRSSWQLTEVLKTTETPKPKQPQSATEGWDWEDRGRTKSRRR